MSVRDLGKQITDNNKDKDRIKTQFASADATAYFKFFEDNATASDVTTVIQTVDTSEIPLWDRDQAWWDNTSSGTKYVWDGGTASTSSTVYAIVNSNNVYIETFQDAEFNDTGSTTATWTGGGTVSF